MEKDFLKKNNNPLLSEEVDFFDSDLQILNYESSGTKQSQSEDIPDELFNQNDDVNKLDYPEIFDFEKIINNILNEN